MIVGATEGAKTRMPSKLMRWMVGAIVMIAAATATAQPSSQFLAEFQAGTDAYRLGQYAEARAHLERAMAIEPSLPGPPRFLAAVDAAESKWAECVGHARTAMHKVRRICQPVTLEELLAVTECWVDTALQLGDKALATMERLVRAQNKRFVAAPGAAPAPAVNAARA